MKSRIPRLIRPVLGFAEDHIRRSLSDPEYRELQRMILQLRRVPRFRACQADIYNWRLQLPDAASAIGIFRELFVNQAFRVPPAEQPLRVLDLGANVGLSVLYFKHLDPRCRVTAIEADPAVFRYLVENVHGNGFTDVMLRNEVAWDSEGTVEFCPDGSDGGHVVAGAAVGTVRVNATDTAELLKQNPYDFLKMDIEGAEERVFPRCVPFLSQLKYVFLEYHSRFGEPQALPAMLAALASAGFRIHVREVSTSSSPFFDLKVRNGFDLQLAIFAWRATTAVSPGSSSPR